MTKKATTKSDRTAKAEDECLASLKAERIQLVETGHTNRSAAELTVSEDCSRRSEAGWRVRSSAPPTASRTRRDGPRRR